MLRFTVVILCAFFILTLSGCDIDLSEQGQKDRAIAEKVTEDLFKRQIIFGEVIKEVKYNKGTKGTYEFNFLKKDLSAQEIFDWTLLLMQTVERADAAVASGRGALTVNGKMGGDHVVTGKYISGPREIPYVITLEGTMAGQSIIDIYDPGAAKERLEIN
jgi:hypothetical protein